MVKSNINYFGIIGCAIIYSVTCFASAFIGFLNPWCWIVGFPVLAAVLGAPTYLWAASRWQRFGVATLFSALFVVLLLSMGEIYFPQCVLMVAAGFISDEYVRGLSPDMLAHQAEAYSPAVFILIIIEIMLVDDIMVIHATNVDADTPLCFSLQRGKSC